MDLDAFTVILAHRLAAVIPAGFFVEAADGMLRYTCDRGRFPGQQGNYDCGEVGVYVPEATHDPWPGTRGQPAPYARISGGTLQLGYGDPGDAVLGCAPIRLADVAAP